MKSLALFAALTAALALPTAAQAKVSRHELRNDVRDVHQERHDLARAVHSGNAARIKAERRELRGAKQELREDARAFVAQHRH